MTRLSVAAAAAAVTGVHLETGKYALKACT